MNTQIENETHTGRAADSGPVGSMRDAGSRRLAASLVNEGYAVGGFVRAVCGIWVDASNPDAIETIYRIKGEGRVGRPISAMIPTSDFVRLIDPEEVPAQLRSVVLDGGELEARFGSLGFMRAAIRRDAAESLPPSLVSRTPDGRCWMQNYIPTARENARLFLDEMLAQGVGFPSATSMNVSGEPEIVEQDEGVEFCKAHGMPLFLADPGDKGRVRGSFPIISIDRTGIALLREGQFPGYLVRYLFGCEVNMSNTVPAKYPALETHGEREASTIPPRRLHDEIAARLDGEESAG